MRYSDQGLMAWAVASVRVEPKGSHRHDEAGFAAKFDPPMAAFNATAPISTEP